MRLRHRIVPLLLALSLSGCLPQPVNAQTDGRPSETQTVTVPRESQWPVVDSCDAQTAKSVQDWIGAWRQWHRHGAQLDDHGSKFVEKDGPRLTPETIIVQLSTDGLFVDNRGVWRHPMNASRARVALKRELKRAEERRGGPSPMSLAVGADVTGRQLLEVLPMLEKLDFRLAFQAAPIAAEYRVPDSIREKHPKLYSRRGLLSLQAPEPEQACQPLAQMGIALSKTEEAGRGEALGAQRWEVLERLLGPAWVDCGCHSDIALDLVAWTSRFHRRPLAAAGNIVDATAPPVVVKADSTWAQIVADLPERPVWFVKPVAERVPSVSVGRPIVMGSLDKGTVDEVVSQHLGEIEQCYEAAFRKDPELQGELIVRFTIAANGEVVSAVLKQSNLKAHGIEQCALNRIGEWKFPQPGRGGIVIANYPFRLRF